MNLEQLKEEIITRCEAMGMLVTQDAYQEILSEVDYAQSEGIKAEEQLDFIFSAETLNDRKHYFTEVQLESKKQLDSLEIKNYIISPDGEVQVKGNVDLDSKGLFHIPVRFGRVEGNFSIHKNYLTTLQNCPKEVGGDFICSDNKLTTLSGAPKVVGGDFECSFNDLESLQNGPEVVNGNYSCQGNQLTTLEGCPKVVEKNFNASFNKLTSLKGGPEIVGGNYNVSKNALSTSYYLPENVLGVFKHDGVKNKGILPNLPLSEIKKAQSQSVKPLYEFKSYTQNPFKSKSPVIRM